MCEHGVRARNGSTKNILPQPRTNFHVCLIDGAARILSYLLCCDRESELPLSRLVSCYGAAAGDPGHGQVLTQGIEGVLRLNISQARLGFCFMTTWYLVLTYSGMDTHCVGSGQQIMNSLVPNCACNANILPLPSGATNIECRLGSQLGFKPIPATPRAP